MDAALNLMFYAPLGAAGFLAIRRGWLGWGAAVTAGGGLSWAIEWLQLWSVSRYGNLTDLAFNIAGTFAGATLALAAAKARWAPPISARWRLNRTGILFLGAWLLWEMFPFVPILFLSRLTEFATRMAPWSWLGFAEHMAGFAVLRLALGRSSWLWLALAALPAQAFLVDRSFALSSMCGAVLGWTAAEFTGVSALSVALPAWLVFEELRPFRFAQDPSPFMWAPFATWYEGPAANFYPVMFGKLFLYLSVIWILRKRGASWGWSAGIPMAILAGGEWAQRYIPGRTPESTDVVLLAAAAVLLKLSQFPVKRQQREVQRA